MSELDKHPLSVAAKKYTDTKVSELESKVDDASASASADTIALVDGVVEEKIVEVETNIDLHIEELQESLNDSIKTVRSESEVRFEALEDAAATPSATPEHIEVVRDELKSEIKKAAIKPRRRFNEAIRETVDTWVDAVVKIYNDFRIASLTCLASLLFLTYTVLSHVVEINPADVSVEFLGIIATLITGVLANVKLFVSERSSDFQDRREHEQWMERQALRIEVAREGLNVEFEKAE